MTNDPDIKVFERTRQYIRILHIILWLLFGANMIFAFNMASLISYMGDWNSNTNLQLLWFGFNIVIVALKYYGEKIINNKFGKSTWSVLD